MILALRSNEFISRIKTLFSQVNPFAVVDYQGNFVIYRSQCDAYFDVLSDLADFFPKGYIQLRLYIAEKCSLTYSQMARLERLSLNSRFLKGFEILWDYKGDRKESMQIAENILRTMHLLTETQFDKSAFLMAYMMFEQKISKAKE